MSKYDKVDKEEDMKEHKTHLIIVSSFPIWRRKETKKKKSRAVILLKKNLQRAMIFFAERDRQRQREPEFPLEHVLCG